MADSISDGAHGNTDRQNMANQKTLSSGFFIRRSPSTTKRHETRSSAPLDASQRNAPLAVDEKENFKFERRFELQNPSKWCERVAHCMMTWWNNWKACYRLLNTGPKTSEYQRCSPTRGTPQGESTDNEITI